MRVVLDTLLPVFALILLGYLLRRIMLPERAFWTGANQLSYFVLLPALLVNQLAQATFRFDRIGDLWGVAIGAIVGVTLLVLLAKRWVSDTNAAFTSVLQGCIRPNTYVALALATALYGQAGLAYMALTLAATVPLVNVISVAALVYYRGNAVDKRGAMAFRSLARSVFQNPLILACALGLTLNVSGMGAPTDVANILGPLAQASLPIGLLTVGAGLDLALLHTALRPLVSATVIKLILSPALAWGLCRLLGVDALLSSLCILFLALPCASASYVLAERMGGDYQLMAGILTVETVAAGLTLPLLLFWLL
ncbi:MAG: AEC family transporter [Caldilineaceae bacterium]|nr:AEC family transporter [Caldilineaceae bacterium]